jgi:hypothetical protein
MSTLFFIVASLAAVVVDVHRSRLRRLRAALLHSRSPRRIRLTDALHRAHIRVGQLQPALDGS